MGARCVMIRPMGWSVVFAACGIFAVCGNAEPPRAAPTPAFPVVVAGVGVPREELLSRAVAFDEHQSFSGLAAVRPYVTRLVIEERWAVRDALALGVSVPDARIDAALERVRREWAPRPWADLLAFFGATDASLRERVRSELSARAVADATLHRTHTNTAYGRAFIRRYARRRAQTACLRPWAVADRCPGVKGLGNDESWLNLGVGHLTSLNHPDRRELELDLAPLLGIRSGDPSGRGYRNAQNRLRRAVRRRSAALARRVKFSYDAYSVYVRGSRADEIAVARVAHRMVHGRRVPVLL
jgi:hypothetical protein